MATIVNEEFSHIKTDAACANDGNGIVQLYITFEHVDVAHNPRIIICAGHIPSPWFHARRQHHFVVREQLACLNVGV